MRVGYVLYLFVYNLFFVMPDNETMQYSTSANKYTSMKMWWDVQSLLKELLRCVLLKVFMLFHL